MKFAVSKIKVKRKDTRMIQEFKLENFALYHTNLMLAEGLVNASIPQAIS